MIHYRYADLLYYLVVDKQLSLTLPPSESSVFIQHFALTKPLPAKVIAVLTQHVDYLQEHYASLIPRRVSYQMRLSMLKQDYPVAIKDNHCVTTQDTLLINYQIEHDKQYFINLVGHYGVNFHYY